MHDPENLSASVHRKRFLTPSLALKFLCTGELNPRSKLIRLSDRYRRLSSLVASDRDVAAEHTALTQAVLARDAERAVELVERHFLETAARVLAGSIDFKGNLSDTMERLRAQVRAGDGRSPSSAKAVTISGQARRARS